MVMGVDNNVECVVNGGGGCGYYMAWHWYL